MTYSAPETRSGSTDQSCDDLDNVRPGAADPVDVVIEGLRALGPARSLADVRQLITTAAAGGLPGAADAALTCRVKDRFRTVAHTGDPTSTVDALQYHHGGPCVDAVLNSDAVVHVEDLRTDLRWRAFARAALEQTPVLGVLSYRLAVGERDDPLGSLTVYSTKPHAFDPDTIAIGQRLAAFAAVVLGYVTERDKAQHLEHALHSSRDIGAATGILMSRHLLTRDQALDLLITTSQNTNRKLRDLAEVVVATGDITAVDDLVTTRGNAQ